MTPSPAITALLGQARLAALEAFAGHTATRSLLPKIADFIRLTVVRQVALGMWDDFLPQRGPEITDPVAFSGFDKLDVKITFGSTLANEPPLKIEFDFARTAIPMLVVKSVKETKGQS